MAAARGLGSSGQAAPLGLPAPRPRRSPGGPRRAAGGSPPGTGPALFRPAVNGDQSNLTSVAPLGRATVPPDSPWSFWHQLFGDQALGQAFQDDERLQDGILEPVEGPTCPACLLQDTPSRLVGEVGQVLGERGDLVVSPHDLRHRLPNGAGGEVAELVLGRQRAREEHSLDRLSCRGLLVAR